jgi:hypothetical protein
MTPPHLPPALAESLLRRSIANPEWRDAVSGDLREEFAELSHRRGARPARRWYWRQALGLAFRFTTSRLVPMAAPRRSMSIPDADSEGRSGWTWLNDGRYALRALAARPALSSVIVVTLALALGANATIFNLADALYLRPFRFAEVDRLVVVASAPDNDPLADRSSVAPADYRDWVRESSTLTDFAAADFWDPNLSEVDQPEQLAGFRVSPGFFRAEDDAGHWPDVPGRRGHARPRPARRALVMASGCGASAPTPPWWPHHSTEWRAARGGRCHAPGPSIPYGAEIWAPLASPRRSGRSAGAVGCWSSLAWARARAWGRLGPRCGPSWRASASSSPRRTRHAKCPSAVSSRGCATRVPARSWPSGKRPPCCCC